jgi:hypothetical protein
LVQKPKDRGASSPVGTFSGGAGGKPKAPPPARESDPDIEFDLISEIPPEKPRLTFPPPAQAPRASTGEMVLGEIESNAKDRSSSSFPPPLGQSEEHDAWTMERLSRQSTVPPVRHDDVDRLRRMSAMKLDEVTELESGGALDLVDRSRPSQQLDLIGEMEELYALDDLTGALRYAELVLGRTPDHEQAQRCANNCRARLIQLYSSKIGGTSFVVTVALSESQLRWLGLDHRSGFLLSRIDGISTVEELLDVCGMPRLEALKTLADLLERGAIRLNRA